MPSPERLEELRNNMNKMKDVYISDLENNQKIEINDINQIVKQFAFTNRVPICNMFVEADWCFGSPIIKIGARVTRTPEEIETEFQYLAKLEEYNEKAKEVNKEQRYKIFLELQKEFGEK